MDNKDQPQPSIKNMPPRPGYEQPSIRSSKPIPPDTMHHPGRPSIDVLKPLETQPVPDRSEEEITPADLKKDKDEVRSANPRRFGRRGFLALGLGAGLATAIGALGLRVKNSGESSNGADFADATAEPTQVPEAAPSPPTATSTAVQPESVATSLPVAREATPTAQATTKEAVSSPSTVVKEVKVLEPKEIPKDVLSKEKLENMHVRILNSPNWDLLIREGAIKLSPTLQWVQNKDEAESKAMLEKYDAVVKKSMSGQPIIDEERKLLQRSTKINRYYPNRSVTFVLVDESMITEEAMTPEQKAAIPADVFRKIKLDDGFEGGQILYSPVGSDEKTVECFIYIATKPLWNNEKYTSGQSFPRAGTDIVLDEKQTNISLLDQYPLRSKTGKGKNPTILIRHEDDHINSEHPVTDRNVYRGLESATQALDNGDDSEYYYVMVKKDPEGKPEEVIVGQDSNHDVSNIAA